MSVNRALKNLQENMRDVERLLEIHAELTGQEKGRRSGVEVLNKSAIVLITAAWEAFVEDLAIEGFDFLLNNASTHDAIPSKVRGLVGEDLLKASDSKDLWKLADMGWKSILKTHKKKYHKRYAGDLNTPKYKQIDTLFESLLGIRSVSRFWYWQRQSADYSRTRLDKYITVRGQIAHRASTEESITKLYVKEYANFIYRLAVKTANRTSTHIHKLVEADPWDLVTYEELVKTGT